MKNPFRAFFASQNARRDAALGVDARERFLVEELGLEPATFDPATNEEHAQIARDLALEPDIRELEDDVRRAEDLVPSIGTPLQYLTGLVLIAGVEFWGSLLVVRALGAPPEHRMLIAIGLTLAILYLTHRLAESSAPPPSGAPLGARFAHAAKRILVPIVYGLVVVSIAATRSGAEGGGAESLSLTEGVLMVFTTVGPAWLAAYLETRRAPASELAKRLRTLRRRLRVLQSRYERARTYVRDLERARSAWRAATARMDARYSVHHELATARGRHTTR